jgi:hypothetical protein
MSMTEDERAPRSDIIEILIAVEIVEVRPFAASDEQRLSADGPEGARGTVDTAGD